MFLKPNGLNFKKLLEKTYVSEAKMELKGEKETLNLYKIGVGGLRR